jgi:hypothetical protein
VSELRIPFSSLRTCAEAEHDARGVRGSPRHPVATLRIGSRAANAIDTAARSLLMLVARDPEGMLAALAAARSAA